MASRRISSQTIESSAVSSTVPERQSEWQSSGERQTSGSASPARTPANRALRSPLDDSLALWGAGRRDRIAELEVELRRVDRWRQHASSQQDSGRISAGQRCKGTLKKREADAVNERRKGGGEEGKQQDGREEREDQHLQRQRATDSGDVPLTLQDRIASWERGWRPPPLRDLPREGAGFFSAWTHLGQPERFELVKSANRSSGSYGEALTDDELEWAVLCLEESEALMSAFDFSIAAGILENVLGRCPGFTLAYYRLALCLLAARGAHASRQVTRLLDCAMLLEGSDNRHLAAAVDLVLRIMSNDAIPEESWSEDHPKSLGDLRALEAAVDHL